MGFLELLTLVFIALKVFEVITWSWLVVLSPAIVAFVGYAVWFFVFGMIFRKASKDINKQFGRATFKKW